MSADVFLIANGAEVYAIPTKLCEQFALEGDKLTMAQTVLKEESGGDVEGQCYESGFPMLRSTPYLL